MGIEWVESAIEGIACTYFLEERQRLPAKLILDSSATQLSVLTGERFDFQELSYAVQSVAETYSLQERGQRFFPPDVINILGPGDAQSLVMVLIEEGGRNQKFRFCLALQ